VVQPLERRKASALGGDVNVLTVAFLSRAPAYNPVWDDKSPDISPLEADLRRNVAALRSDRAEAERQVHMRSLGEDPYPGFVPGARKLPPPPGLAKAQAAFDAAHAAAEAAAAAAAGRGPASAGRAAGDYRPRDKFVAYGCKSGEETETFKVKGGSVQFLSPRIHSTGTGLMETGRATGRRQDTQNRTFSDGKAYLSRALQFL